MAKQQQRKMRNFSRGQGGRMTGQGWGRCIHYFTKVRGKSNTDAQKLCHHVITKARGQKFLTESQKAGKRRARQTTPPRRR